MNFDLVDIAIVVTLDIAYLPRLFAAGAAAAHPIRSTNGRVIPGVAKLARHFQITFSSPVSETCRGINFSSFGSDLISILSGRMLSRVGWCGSVGTPFLIWLS